MSLISVSLYRIENEEVCQFEESARLASFGGGRWRKRERRRKIWLIWCQNPQFLATSCPWADQLSFKCNQNIQRREIKKLKKEVKLAPEPWGLHAEKSCSTYSQSWEPFSCFAQCLYPRGDNKWSADYGKFDWCLYLNFYNLKTYLVHFSFRLDLGRASPAVLIVHLYSSSCSTIETHICGVSEEIYLFRDTKDTIVLKTGFLHTRCKKGTNKTLKMTSHRQICEVPLTTHFHDFRILPLLFQVCG